MVILGLLLILLGALAIVAAFFTTAGTGVEFLGLDISPLALFFFGVAAGAAVLWGLAILKWGTKRGFERRKERKKINHLQDRLDRADAERRPAEPPRDERL